MCMNTCENGMDSLNYYRIQMLEIAHKYKFCFRMTKDPFKW